MTSIPFRKEDNMKHARRIISFILIICMLASMCAFAATPKASIISPINNSVVSDDKLLVSVKVSDKKKISVQLFEEKVLVGTKYDEEQKIDVPILKAIDVSDFTENILKGISEEYAEKKVLIIGEGDSKQELRAVAVTEAATYTATGEVGYFSKQIEKLNPGLYRVQVNVLGKEDVVEESYDSFVALQKKQDAEEKTTDVVPVETVKISIVQFIARLLKSLIK